MLALDSFIGTDSYTPGKRAERILKRILLVVSFPAKPIVLSLKKCFSLIFSNVVDICGNSLFNQLLSLMIIPSLICLKLF